jgi:hypothetical protein
MPSEMAGTAISIIGCVVVFLFAQTASGEELAVQRLDSINADPAAGKTVVQQVYQLILKMVDSWNKHDLDGYMSGFWKSDDLLAVIESEVHWGWSDLSASFHRGYPDRDKMGKIDLQRLQIRSATPDTAVALCWWRILPPRGGSPVFVTDTMQLQKFTEGWRITVEHSSFLEP